MKKNLTLLASFLFLFFATALAQDVVPDLSFGQNGIAATASPDAFSCAARQSDGKVVAASRGGDLNFPNGSLTVVRFNTDGTVDTNFGTNGKASISFNPVPWPFIGTRPASTSAISNAYSIAVNKDGKIALAGRAYYGDGWFSGFGYVFVVFNPDGTPVGGSSAITPLLNVVFTGDLYASDIRATSVVAQSDGKFVVAGQKMLIAGLNSVVGTNFIVARYNADGSLEKMVETPAPRSFRLTRGVFATSVAVQDNGQIIVAGEGNHSLDPIPPVNRVLLRYNSDLTLDNTFGTSGIAYTPFQISISDSPLPGFRNSSDHAITVQTDGKIIATGADNTGLAVARFNTDGTLDGTFGVGGITSTGLPAKTTSVSILGNGKIMAAGADGSNFGLARLITDGTLDGTFGTGGKFTKTIVGMTSSNTLITPDHFYAVGTSQGMGAIAAFMFNNNTIVLPLQLTDFAARLIGNNGVLDWRTASEENTSHFEIERSLDNRTYVSAGNVGAAGHSSLPQLYSFTDKNIAALSVPVVYYRLKMVDGNGSFSYSKTIPVNINGRATLVKLYPNPVRDIATLQIVSMQSETIRYTVTDASGSTVLAKSITVTEGNNNVIIDTHALSSGNYTLLLRGAETSKEIKIVKQ